MLHTISLTTTAACLVLMQGKSSQPWPRWLPSVFFAMSGANKVMSKPTAWFGRKHIKNSWCLCLPWRRHSSVFHLGFATRRPNSSPLEGLEGWACAAHCPSWDHKVLVLFCRGALLLDRWRATGHPGKSHILLLWGSCRSHLMFNNTPTQPAGEQSCEIGPHHPGAPQSHLFAAKTKEWRISYIKGWRWEMEEGQRCLPIISCLWESARRQRKLSGSNSASCSVE